ncbi:MAG: ATP-binding cassette domain-containing protein [Gammaproteobacteria bacterium]|nr:ATP-binding cassette domain-containing protein [Gammaproteobacteria bacterium]
MSILRFRNITLGFGGPTLFAGINLQIDRGERLCLIGRNGSGKSTLLKLLHGDLTAEEGVIEAGQGLKIAMMAQEVSTQTRGSVFDVVASGLEKIGELLSAYHQISQSLDEHSSADDLKRLADIQHEFEALNGWELNQRVITSCSRLSLDEDARYENLSGGQKRRVLLARALMVEPDILLLDEPTNHLDVASIEWLENFLLSCKTTLIFITHDRTFLSNLATRIIELDRGRLTSWPGDYENFLLRREENLETEEKHNALFDKRLAAEEVWIRKGIKARRTRNEGRVRALQALRRQRGERRNLQGKAKMDIQMQSLSGKIVMEATSLNYAVAGQTLVKDFSATILRGDKIGILGANGCGKTTLIRLLLEQLKPDSGSLKTGTTIELAYFDQMREELDAETTVQDSVNDGKEFVEVDGQQRHVLSYLQDFLFLPERARQPVKALSGGERNRLLLARLFSRSFNVLVMDEPTNDLDIETLEILEERLTNFEGTLLLVSHDRSFINNVVTSCLLFPDNDSAEKGIIFEAVGGYDDAIAQYENSKKPRGAKQSKPAAAVKQGAEDKDRASVKLSYKDQRELDSLPQDIEKLEQEQQRLQEKMTKTEYYQQDAAVITKNNQLLASIEADLKLFYARWDELESV